MKSFWKEKGFSTKAIHAGQPPEPVTGAVIPPIYQTSTYAQKAPGEHTGYEYSRTKNPTRNALEECLAELECGEYGAAFSSGMGATTTLLHMLPQGSHVICCDDVYGGTQRLFNKVLTDRSFSFSYADLTSLDEIEKVCTSSTKMIWIETPTNPLLKVIDIEKICSWAKSKNILTVVDNTFASPFLQTPISLGADLVMHSMTKYLGGHSDVIGGAIVTKNSDLAEKMYFLQNSMGAICGPMDAWLTLRGIKTLGIRMERHCSNAKKIVSYLENHSKVTNIFYPGLPSHPTHEVATKQMKDFGGMISVQMKTNLSQTKEALSKCKVFTLAESLGGVESLIEHPAIMTHASVPLEIREKLGISDGLIRLSVGIEDPEDLIADLDQAFS